MITIGKIAIKIILTILFLLCLSKISYGYFRIVRFLGMSVFIWLAYNDRKKSDKTFLIIWAVSALLITPFIKVALGRTAWNIVDIVWAIILVVSIWMDKKATGDKNRSQHYVV